MRFAIGKKICFLVGLMVLLLTFGSASEFTHSRATYYGPPGTYGTSSGACGFGKLGQTLNGGSVSAVSRLYRNGAGCGACYQVRCINPQLCNYDGVKIVVTDYGEGDRTDFILSGRAYANMALGDAEKELELFAYGVVDVQYKRVSCHSGHNIMYKINEYSSYPYYLALILIFVDGQYDVTRVELRQCKCRGWVPMRRAYGAVWDMANPPRGSIHVRFQVEDTAGKTYWVEPPNGIPQNWKAGAAYDTNVQLI